MVFGYSSFNRLRQWRTEGWKNQPREALWKETKTEVPILEVMTVAQVESIGQLNELDQDVTKLFDEIP